MIAVGALAGDDKQASLLSLPAAATTVIPALVSFTTASVIIDEAGPPILKLRTAAVFELVFSGDKIQSRPATTVA